MKIKIEEVKRLNYSTIAVVVGLQDYQDILEERNEGKSVEYQRKNTQNIIVVLYVFGEGASKHI